VCLVTEVVCDGFIPSVADAPPFTDLRNSSARNCSTHAQYQQSTDKCDKGRLSLLEKATRNYDQTKLWDVRSESVELFFGDYLNRK